MSKIITTTGQTDIDVSSSTPNQIVKVIKTADETVTNSAILQDDNELKFNVGANQTWLIDYTLIVTGIDTIADIKFHMTNPGGATAYWNPSAINDDGGASWSGRILGQSPAALLPIGTDIVCGTLEVRLELN